MHKNFRKYLAIQYFVSEEVVIKQYNLFRFIIF